MNVLHELFGRVIMILYSVYIIGTIDELMDELRSES